MDKCPINIMALLEKIQQQIIDLSWCNQQKNLWRGKYIGFKKGEQIFYDSFVAINPEKLIEIKISFVYRAPREIQFNRSEHEHYYMISLERRAPDAIRKFLEWYSYIGESEYEMFEKIYHKLLEHSKASDRVDAYEFDELLGML